MPVLVETQGPMGPKVLTGKEAAAAAVTEAKWKGKTFRKVPKSNRHTLCLGDRAGTVLGSENIPVEEVTGVDRELASARARECG